MVFFETRELLRDQRFDSRRKIKSNCFLVNFLGFVLSSFTLLKHRFLAMT